MSPSPIYTAAPQRGTVLSHVSGAQSHRQAPVPGPRYLRPVAAHRQQQPLRQPHRPVWHQGKLPSRRRRPQGLQQIRRETQQLRRQQSPHLGRQSTVQRSPGRHQHRRPGDGVAQGVSRIVEGRHGHHPALQAHSHRQEPPLHAPFGRRPEHHRHHSVGCRRGNEQHPGVHVRIEDAPRHGHAAGEEPQSQHAPGHGAGEGEKQQRQPRQLLLPAESRQGQQHPRCQFCRRLCQEGEPREKHRRCVDASQQRPQEIPPPPQWPPRQTGRTHQQQIVHHRVEGEHTVDIDHRHAPFPLSTVSGSQGGPADLIIGRPARKSRRKKGPAVPSPRKNREPPKARLPVPGSVIQFSRANTRAPSFQVSSTRMVRSAGPGVSRGLRSSKTKSARLPGARVPFSLSSKYW